MHDHYQHACGAGLAAPQRLSYFSSDCLAALGTTGDSPPCLIEPYKDEALGLQAEGFSETTKADNLNCAAEAAADQAATDRSAFAALRAQLAFKGYRLVANARNGLLIFRWKYALHCENLEAVRAFCSRVGGPS